MEAAKRKGNRLETDTELMDDTVCGVIVVAFMIGGEVWIAKGGKRSFVYKEVRYHPF